MKKTNSQSAAYSAAANSAPSLLSSNISTSTMNNPWITDINTTTYPSNIATTTGLAANYSWNNGYYDVDIVTGTLKKLIPLLEVKRIEKIGNKRYIVHFKHLSKDIYLREHGCIYIRAAEAYGVYTVGDYEYWRDAVIVEFGTEEEASRIKPGMKFTFLNNFDQGITNEEVSKYLDSREEYKNAMHKILEKEFAKGSDFSYRIKAHKSLDEYL